MQNRRTHYFNDGIVITGLCGNGVYGAHLQDELAPRGYGHSRFAAIADLNEKIGSTDREEFDHQAAACDHAYDLRKNEAA